MSNTPCSKVELSSFIQAYAIAYKTENNVLTGLTGDAINKLLNTLTFKEDLAAEAEKAAAAKQRGRSRSQ